MSKLSIVQLTDGKFLVRQTDYLIFHSYWGRSATGTFESPEGIKAHCMLDTLEEATRNFELITERALDKKKYTDGGIIKSGKVIRIEKFST